MLDLDTIFDPARVEATVAAQYRRNRCRLGLNETGVTIPKQADISVEDLPSDWRVWFEERAAVKEYDGGLPRERAEAEALLETVEQMKLAEMMRG